MKLFFRSFAVLFVVAIGVAAQQVQSLDSTDSERTRREKTNANFTFLNNKIITSVAAKENPLTFGGPLSRTGNTIQCPTCLAGEINADGYASLTAAVADIGASSSTLTISAAKAVTTNLTIPANVVTRFTGVGTIAVSNGVTLTINGPLDAPLRQVFSGAGSVRFGVHIEKSFPQWFGAAFNNSTDDTVAIQKAIDAYTRTNKPHGGGEVFISGGAVISATLNIHETSVVIRGPGWGIESEAPYRGFLRWNGSAGLPMIKIADCMNAGVEGIRLIGKTSAKPSAGIEYTRTVSAVVQADQIFARHVWIGSYFGYDSNAARQFAAGILISGGVDTDTNYFEHLALVHCDIGIDLQNPNASVTDYRTILFSGCGVGFKAGARVIGSVWNFGANDLDMQLVDNVGRLSLNDVTSEGAVKFAVMGVSTELYIDNLGFQVSNTLNGDGIIIDADTSDAHVVLRDALFTKVGGYTGATPRLLIRNTGGGSHNYIRLENVKGLYQGNLDFATVGGGFGDMREVFNHRRPDSNLDWGINDHFYLTNSDTYSEGRNDFASKVNIFGGPFTVKQLAAPSSVTVVATGGSGTTYGYRVTAISGTGETLASSSTTVSGGAVLSGSVYNTVRWDPVLGADGYKVYGRTNGSELLMATIRPSSGTFADGSQVTSFKDTGALTPSGALPTLNTTGTITAEGATTIGGLVTLVPSPGQSWQTITTDSIASGLQIKASGGSPKFSIFPDAHGFAGLYLEAGSASGSDINFRMTPGGTTALRIKQGTGALELDRTITAGGTTGAVTINKIAGTVNIAATGSSVTVTNSLVTTSSIILPVLRTNDSTASIKNVVAGSGSFTINLTLPATGEVSIGFVVLN